MEKYPFNAARYPDEDFKTYQLRRWNETQFFKWLARPSLFWDPSEKDQYGVPKGRYIRGAEVHEFKLDIVE